MTSAIPGVLTAQPSELVVATRPLEKDLVRVRLAPNNLAELNLGFQRLDLIFDGWCRCDFGSGSVRILPKAMPTYGVGEVLFLFQLGSFLLSLPSPSTAWHAHQQLPQSAACKEHGEKHCPFWQLHK